MDICSNLTPLDPVIVLHHLNIVFVVLVDYDTLLELNAKAAEELRAKEAEEDEQEVQ